MNVYLKSAVQNLDAAITQLTEYRNGLLAYLGAGVQTLEPMHPVSPPAVPIVKPREPRTTPKTRKQKRRSPAEREKEETKIPAAAPVVSRSAGGERAKTLGGAMKLIIGAMGTSTREAVREALQKDYGTEEFVRDASTSAFSGNLGYWLKNGKLEEGENGVLKVVDKEFFGNVEFVK